MSGSMVDIQSGTAEIRRGKKIERKKKKPRAAIKNESQFWSSCTTLGFEMDHPVLTAWLQHGAFIIVHL